MVCSFGEADMAVVRLYCTARAVSFEESPLSERLFGSPAEELKLPSRQVIEVAVKQTQTSCGYEMPIMLFVREPGSRTATAGSKTRRSSRRGVKDNGSHLTWSTLNPRVV